MVHICGNCLWYQKNCSHFNQFTLQDEDACLIAYMRHEDGNIIYFLSNWCFKVNRSLPLYNAQLPRPFLHSTKMYQLNNWSSILSRSRWNPSTLLQVVMGDNHHRCEIEKYLNIQWKAITEETSTEGIWKYQIAEIGLWRAPTSVPVITQGRILLSFCLIF